MRAFLFCLKKGLGSIGKSITTPLIILIAVAIITTYSLAYPSYLLFKERSTEAPPWLAEINFTSRNRTEVDNLAQELSEAFDQAPIVDSCRSESLITTDEQALKNASSTSLDLVSAFLLNQPEKTFYPIDVYLPKNFVIAGNPYYGDGLIVDAHTAQNIGVTAGDILYVGLKFPKESANGQTVSIPNSEDMAENVVFTAKEVSAIVMPSSLFEGIALFQPAESVIAYEQDGEASCTQLYLLGESQKDLQETWQQVENKATMDGVYFQPASEEIQWAKDTYAQDIGGRQTFTTAIVTGIFIVFLLLTLDGLRKQQKQIKNAAVFMAIGAKKITLICSYGLSFLIFYGTINALGCLTGFLAANYAYPIWIPPELKVKAIFIITAITIAATILQCGVMAFRFRRMDLCSFLSEERE